jgi:hypothetical protein
MTIDLFLETAALFLALAAVLMQPKRNPDEPASWRNLSAVGRILLAVIVIVGIVKIGKSIRDATAQRMERDAHAKEVAQLNSNITDLRETNTHLIKVMSVADGYNALVSGTVTFQRAVGEPEIKHALENMFLKYAHVNLEAKNKLGVYHGRIDYGVHPLLWKYRRLSEIQSAPELVRLRESVPPGAIDRSYYFELRCSGLKIFSDAKIQYAHFGPSDRLDAHLEVFSWWHDFQALYAIEHVFIDKITIEELGDIPIHKAL